MGQGMGIWGSLIAALRPLKNAFERLLWAFWGTHPAVPTPSGFEALWAEFLRFSEQGLGWVKKLTEPGEKGSCKGLALPTVLLLDGLACT